MGLSHLTLTGACAPIVAALSCATADNVLDAQVPAAWTTPGTEWLIYVKQYSLGWAIALSNPQKAKEAQEPKVQHEFDMRITVLEPQGEGDKRIARVQFTPSDNAPDFLRGQIRVLELDATSGKVKSIKERTYDSGAVEAADTIGTGRILDTPVSGFPIEWIINPADVALVPPRENDRSVTNKPGDSFIKKLRPTVTRDDGRPAVEVAAATTWPDTEPYRKVVQTWVPGESWWRSYTSYIHGHIYVEATLVEHKGK